MRFSAAAVLAFAATALAQTPDFDPIYTPEKDETVAAGSPFTVTWDAPAKYAAGTISIELIGGATQNTQQHIANIACKFDTRAKVANHQLTCPLSWSPEQRQDVHVERRRFARRRKCLWPRL